MAHLWCNVRYTSNCSERYSTSVRERRARWTPSSTKSTPNGRLERSGMRTRRRLLDAGRTHFARLGYTGTSVQAVLAEAGVSPPVLYHHYGDKAGLFVAVGQEVYAEFLARLRLAVPEQARFEEALDAVLVEAARITWTEPALPQMAFTVQMEIGVTTGWPRGCFRQCGLSKHSSTSWLGWIQTVCVLRSPPSISLVP